MSIFQKFLYDSFYFIKVFDRNAKNFCKKVKFSVDRQLNIFSDPESVTFACTQKKR